MGIWWPEEMEAAAPPERLTISEWSEKYRVLLKPAPEEGPLKLNRTPYFIPLMNLCQYPEVEEVVVCASAQIAKTEFAISVAGYYIHQEPCPVMYILADEDTSKYVSQQRLQKMFKASPTLSKLIDPPNFGIYEMAFKNGAYLAMGWASSVAKLASRPMRVVLLDEIDKPGYDLTTKEASALSLAKERTEAYSGNRLILKVSTPTHEDGNITIELKSCDVIYDWHVPCPYCGVFQPLVWGSEFCYYFPDGIYRDGKNKYRELGKVYWEGGSKASREQVHRAGYQCGSCKKVWTTIEKNHAVENGKMVAREDLDYMPNKVGFHINRLYSLLGKSGDIPKLVKEFLKGRKDVKTLQGFVNSTLGEPFVRIKRERVKSLLIDLKDQRPAGQVPRGVLALTAGVDTQDIGYYYVIRAWGKSMESWLIRYGYVLEEEALDKVLFEDAYRDAADNRHILSAICMDAMGHRTSQVYNYCRARKQIRPTKGEQSMSSPYSMTVIDTFPGTKTPIPGGVELFRVHSNYFKDQIHNMMVIPAADPGAFHLHSEVTDDYLDSMNSEYRDGRGFWQQIKKEPNHYWDCEYLALAAAEILGVKYMEAAAQAAVKIPPAVPPGSGNAPRRLDFNPYTGKPSGSFFRGGHHGR